MKRVDDVRQRRGDRARRRKGSELLEFSMVMLPLLAMVTVVVDMGWAVFAESTLQRAVRIGVRTGVTLTSSSALITQYGDLTTAVKNVVQQNASGLLRNDYATIKVNYLQPPPPSSTSAATDVSGQANGDAPGNIMKVSVVGYSLLPLMPRIYGGKNGIDSNPMIITVNSADIIEPDRSPPAIGTAP